MAKFVFDMGDIGDQLEQLASRENIRRVVEAGAQAAVSVLQRRTEQHHHVVTGELMESITMGKIHEDLGSAWTEVYPGSGGTDENTVKGFVINYGYGGKKTAKTGDKFITGKKPELEEAVQAAMRAEADRIKNEIMR